MMQGSIKNFCKQIQICNSLRPTLCSLSLKKHVGQFERLSRNFKYQLQFAEKQISDCVCFSNRAPWFLKQL